MRVRVTLSLSILVLTIASTHCAYAQSDASSQIELEPIRQRFSPALIYTVSVHGSICRFHYPSYRSSSSLLYPEGSKYSPGLSFDVKLPIENIPILSKCLYIGTSLGVRYSHITDDSYMTRGSESPVIKTWAIEPDLHLTLDVVYIYGRIGYTWSHIFAKSIESNMNPLYIGIGNDCINTRDSFFYYALGVRINKHLMITFGQEKSTYDLFNLNSLYENKRISYQSMQLQGLNLLFKLYIQLYSNGLN